MMSGLTTLRGESDIKKRRLYKLSFKGFSAQDEQGKLRVKSENCEIHDGNIYAAYALKKVTLPGVGEFPKISGATITRVALPADTADGVKMENAIAVCEDNSVYRYNSETLSYDALSGIALTCTPSVTTYFAANKQEYALLFGGQAAAVRAGGTVTILAKTCYKNFGCAAFERVFYASDDKTVNYSGVLAMDDFTESADEGGRITFPVASGMRGICAFKKHVYVFFAREIYRLAAQGAARDFTAEKVPYAGGEIAEGSPVNCGNAICFLTDEGVFAFDGAEAKNVTADRGEFVFSDLSVWYCAGAAGRYLCEFGSSASLTQSVLYNTENSAVSKIILPLKTACAYGNELFVYSGGVKKFVFDRSVESARSYCVSRLNEPLPCRGLKTLRRIKIYGKGSVRFAFSPYGSYTSTTYSVTLSEYGTEIILNATAQAFSFSLFLGNKAFVSGVDAEYSVFDRGR